MNKNKIIESGLLELYVIGSIENSDKRIVEKALKQYPELQSELNLIEDALYFYAKSYALVPPASLKQNILSDIKKQPKTTRNTTPTNVEKVPKPSYLLPFLIAGLTALALLIYTVITQNKFEDLETNYNRDKITCDSISSSFEKSQVMLANLASPNNKVLQVQPTEKFPDTKLIIHHNPENKANYLQLDDLPPLAADQSYQLWSLRDGADPMPLNVFQGDENIFEVSFIDNTSAYAITIEKSGGSTTPDLTNLIGVIPVV